MRQGTGGFLPVPFLIVRAWISRCGWVALAWGLMAQSCLAEKFFTHEQAQKLVFPDADRFVKKVHRFSDAEKKTIEKSTSQKVKNAAQMFWIAYKGETPIGVLVLDGVIGKHELIDYVVGLEMDGSVRQIEILVYRESHGSEIRSEKWRNQFKGKTKQSKLRLHDEIANLSGATLSCRHVTEGVRRVLATYDLVLKPGYLAGQ
jgi:Na+-transporting NADH:ubiquinone oxidoreductase subunit C